MKPALLVAVGLAFGVVACGRTSSVLPGASMQRVSSSVQARELLYISNSMHNVVDIYDAAAHNGKPIGRITAGINSPCGLAVDGSGNLYVANNLANTVTVYAPGQSKPIRTYSRGVNTPVQVLVGADGTLYVANNLAATVTEYAKGSMKPTRTIHNQSSPFGLALDAENNLYVSYPAGGVYEFAPGSTKGKNLNLQIFNNIRGLAIDAAGDLLVANFGYPRRFSSILVFEPGTTWPSFAIRNKNLVQPISIVFGPSKKLLYEADNGLSHRSGGVNVFRYPSGRLLFSDERGVAARAYGVALQ